MTEKGNNNATTDSAQQEPEHSRFEFELRRALLEESSAPDAVEAYLEFLQRNGESLGSSRKKMWVSISLLVAAACIAAVCFISPWRMMNWQNGGAKTLATTDDDKYVCISMGDDKMSLGNRDNFKDMGIFVTKDNVIKVLDTRQSSASQQKAITVSVPSGQTARLVLPDGTQVSLNAASRITFPRHFSQSGVRDVLLEGEAYFEVFHDEVHPFVVHAHEFDVKVLGTRFNVRSYPGETHSVALVEGIVRVEQGGKQVFLQSPDESVIIQHNKLTPATIEPELALDWLRGEFYFDGQDLREVMAEIGRWYHCRVVFAHANSHVEPLHFSASRTTSVQEVIRQLQLISHARIEFNEKLQVLLVK